MRTTDSLVWLLVVAAAAGGCSGSQQSESTTAGGDSAAVAPPAEAIVVDATPVAGPLATDGEMTVAQSVTTPPQPGGGGAANAVPTYEAPLRVATPSPTPPPPPSLEPAPMQAPADASEGWADDMAAGGEPAVEAEEAPSPAAMEPDEGGRRPSRNERAAARRARREERRAARERDRAMRAAPAAGVAPAAPMATATTTESYDLEEATGEAMIAAGQAAPPAPSVLTAAAVADVDRRQNYFGFLSRHGAEAAQLGLDLTRRVRFRVVDGASRPVHDAAITVVSNGAQVTGRTHADGFWDFFPGVAAPQAGGQALLSITANGATSQAAVPIPAAGDGRDVFIRLPQAIAFAPSLLDLAFVIDTTGSMGDELRYVNEEVVGIVDRVRESAPQVNVRVAATFYRDRGDPVPVEQIPFSTDVGQFVAQMRYVQASGGGDYPEDVNLGLAAALTTLQWSTGPAVRVLVIIADAPPQAYPDFPYTYRNAMIDASRLGIRILPVAASGADRVVEFLFRALGAYTSTPYVYLTDDSGVGGTHMEADTDRIAIEMFSDLLTRMLVSDLHGLGMHELVDDQPVFGAQ